MMNDNPAILQARALYNKLREKRMLKNDRQNYKMCSECIRRDNNHERYSVETMKVFIIIQKQGINIGKKNKRYLCEFHAKRHKSYSKR